MLGYSELMQLAKDAGIGPDSVSGLLQARLEIFGRSVEKVACSAERERICAAIKEEDDHCWTGDYMLDSDDCIAVAKGEWKRPEYASN